MVCLVSNFKTTATLKLRPDVEILLFNLRSQDSLLLLDVGMEGTDVVPNILVELDFNRLIYMTDLFIVM
jgi:hypothetical protein